MFGLATSSARSCHDLLTSCILAPAVGAWHDVDRESSRQWDGGGASA